MPDNDINSIENYNKYLRELDYTAHYARIRKTTKTTEINPLVCDRIINTTFYKFLKPESQTALVEEEGYYGYLIALEQILLSKDKESSKSEDIAKLLAELTQKKIEQQQLMILNRKTRLAELNATLKSHKNELDSLENSIKTSNTATEELKELQKAQTNHKWYWPIVILAIAAAYFLAQFWYLYNFGLPAPVAIVIFLSLATFAFVGIKVLGSTQQAINSCSNKILSEDILNNSLSNQTELTKKVDNLQEAITDYKNEPNEFDKSLKKQTEQAQIQTRESSTTLDSNALIQQSIFSKNNNSNNSNNSNDSDDDLNKELN